MPDNRLVKAGDYISLPSTPDAWVIEPLLPASGAMLLYGDPKVGKSFAALQLAKAVSEGSSWLGFPTKQGIVAYIQLDTPRNVWQARIVGLGLGNSEILFGDRELLEAWPFNILNPDHLIRLRDSLQAVSPSLVIIDTLRESHAADENDSTEMQQAVAALVAATQPSALCLISHSRKPSQDEHFSLMNDNRGSSYVVGRMDAIARFTPKTVRVSGRSIEEHTVELERQDNGFWTPQVGEMDMHVLAALIDPAHASLRAASKTLALRVGKSESSCRGMLRRYLAAHPHVRPAYQAI